ncbi:MAG: hypothetical protein RLZZ488_752 [Pseudomonadota bacterium]|jgi:hypothetical protein
MGEILSFKKSKNSQPAAKKKKIPSQTQARSKAAASDKKAKNKKTVQDVKPQARNLTAKGKPKKETLNAASIKLWWISQEFDELIRKAVIEKHIPVEELSAVMAHRLGSLLVVSERTPELTLFCMKVISKITNQKESGSNAS